MPKPVNVTLPPSWTIEFQEEDRLIIRKWDDAGQSLGFVSIDWGWRRFQTGYNGVGIIQEKPAKPYEGRGWHDALLADALKACDHHDF
jgi:hypothetical protein